MHRYLIYIIFCCLCLFACRDHLKIEKNNDPQGYADSQVVGVWKITAFSSNAPYDWNGDGSVETNIFNNWTSCEKDNLYQFVGDKTGTFKFNCSINGAGEWTIVNTLFLVYFLTGQIPDAEQFISMTTNEFKTTRDITVSTGQNFTLTKTWTRQ